MRWTIGIDRGGWEQLLQTVSLPAASLYVLLKGYADEENRLYPTVKTLAKQLRRKERQTRALLNELFAAGVLVKEQRTGTSNIYWLVEKIPLIPAQKGDMQETAYPPPGAPAPPARSHIPPCSGPHTPLQQIAAKVITTEVTPTEVSTTEEKNSPVSSPVVGTTIEETSPRLVTHKRRPEIPQEYYAPTDRLLANIQACCTKVLPFLQGEKREKWRYDTADAIRLLVEVDKVPLGDIMPMLQFIRSDKPRSGWAGWQSAILSGGSLRRSWSKLVIQSSRMPEQEKVHYEADGKEFIPYR